MTAPQNRRVLSPAALAISAAAAITSALLGSLFGDSGTLIGTGLGAVASTGSTSVYEHLAQRARHLGRLQQLEPGWMAGQLRHIPRKVAITALASAALVTGGSYAAIAATEAASGQTLHADVTGAHDPGTSFGGGAVPASTRTPRATFTPEPTPSSCLGGTRCPTSPPSSKTSAAPSNTPKPTSKPPSNSTSPPSSTPPGPSTPIP